MNRARTSLGRRVGGCCLRPEPLERRRLMSAAVWDVYGDVRPKQKADVIRVELEPGDASQLRATVNGKVLGTRDLAGLTTLRVFSGSGDDTVTVDLGDGASRLRVVVVARDGDDRVTVTGVRARIFGDAGDDTITGSDGRDLLAGGAGNDLLEGNGGVDTLRGGRGDDVLAGGRGRDRALGGVGNDRIHGGSNADALIGGTGADTLYGGAGRDIYTPGAGRDRIYREKRIDAEKVIGADDEGDLTFTEPTAREPFRRFRTDAELNAWLIDAAVRRWQGVLGQPAPPPAYYHYALPAPAAGADTVVFNDAPFALASMTTARDHSGTNTQVAGVDEADLIETDGEYLYTAVGSELVIVRADPADQMVVVSRTDVGGPISGIYLADNGTVTVIASPTYVFAGGVIDARLVGMTSDIAYIPQLDKTIVSVYDVSDAAAPALKEKTTIDGQLADSRSVDGRLYAVVTNNLWLPGPEIVGEGDSARYETEAEYRARLQVVFIDRPAQQFSATAGSTTRVGSTLSAADAFVSGDTADTQALTTLVLIDPAAGDIGVDDSATVVGPAGTIYSTADWLYVTGWDWDPETGLVGTNLAKFDLAPAEVSLVAAGSVAGAIVDQFSLGENSRGDLNIATTLGFGNASTNNVFTLRQSGDRLETVGSLLNIAPGERIFSSRFIGDKGYLVTFRQIDPLFTLDLSDPTAPKVVGELKITGFSSYLQPIGDRYLLGLGRAGDDNGNVSGLQLSLFDILDPANPKLLHTYTFSGQRWNSGSSAEHDHHAFQYFPDHGILTLPTYDYDAQLAQDVNGTMVLKLDPATGFQKLGFVSQEGASRSVRIGGALYTLGWNTIKASELADPSHLFGTVQIRDDSFADPWRGGPIATLLPLIDPAAASLSVFRAIN